MVRTPPDQQIEIDFSRPINAPPPASPDEVAALVAWLLGRGWVRAEEIFESAPAGVVLPRSLEGAKRKLRLIAVASDAAIVSWPGSPGYKLFDDTTETEIAHAIQAHGSQIGEMQDRLGAIVRRHNRRRLVHPASTNP